MKVISLLVVACLAVSTAMDEIAVNNEHQASPVCQYQQAMEEPNVVLQQDKEDSDLADTSQGNAQETEEDKETAKSKRTKIVVIGCGPGGKSFLHALATKRKKLQDAGDVEGLAAFPEVTVYEKLQIQEVYGDRSLRHLLKDRLTCLEGSGAIRPALIWNSLIILTKSTLESPCQCIFLERNCWNTCWLE